MVTYGNVWYPYMSPFLLGNPAYKVVLGGRPPLGNTDLRVTTTGHKAGKMALTYINRGHFYAPHVKPVLLDCAFQVQAADSAGLGITNLKGQAVQNVFMHTSATPGRGSNGYLNPNPAAGCILVQLADNFNKFYGHFASLRGPTATSTKIDNGATLTIGNPYVITIVGDATAAQWRTIGVPPGVTPAIGVSFIAIATGAGSGNTSSSRVQSPSASGVSVIENIGSPSADLGPIPVGGSPNYGGWLLFQCLAPSNTAVTSALTMDSYTPAGTITNGTPDTFAGTPAVLTGSIVNSGGVASLARTAPADGSIIHLDMYLGQSNVQVDGE